MMNVIQQKMYNNLVNIATENGCEVTSLVYSSAKDKMEFRCPNGHLRITNAGTFRVNPLGCVVCSGNCPVEAEKKFIVNIEKLKGKVIGKYNGKDEPVECLCINNHICFPYPNSINQGGGMCKKCSGRCSSDAEKNFIENIKKLNGKVIGKYEGAHTPVECLCENNHACFPNPGDIRRGRGMCKKCVNKCPIQAEKNFIENIENLGGTVIGKYVSVNKPVECICKEGHLCYPHPTSIQQGNGMCKKCAGQCPEEAEKNFIKNIENLGGKVIGKYKTSDKRVECVCVNNHICFPHPTRIQQGHDMCPTCTLEQTESKGEKYTSKALDKLGIIYTKQYKHPQLPKLRFDFQFNYENKLFLVEFDGIQHHKYTSYFHRKPLSFEKQRQRDLMKNYIVKNIPDCVLIRLDHEWLKMKDPAESLSEYIWDKMGEPAGSVVADNLLYMWIFDEPTEESISKYFYPQVAT